MDSFFSFQQVTNPCMSWYRMRNDIIFFHYDFSLTTVRKKDKNVSLMQNPYQGPTISKHSWSISQCPREATRPLLYFSSRNVGDPGWVRWRECSVAGLPGSPRYGFPSSCSAFNSDPHSHATTLARLPLVQRLSRNTHLPMKDKLVEGR